eukprot:GHVS01040556.1.p1 GENE.GHVS01040556.1~~GHVS01040556.1.p1  ORF type:complete len:192 (+),score=39.27 GHVS01040556.1:87-578(+)
MPARVVGWCQLLLWRSTLLTDELKELYSNYPDTITAYIVPDDGSGVRTVELRLRLIPRVLTKPMLHLTLTVDLLLALSAGSCCSGVVDVSVCVTHSVDVTDAREDVVTITKSLNTDRASQDNLTNFLKSSLSPVGYGSSLSGLSVHSIAQQRLHNASRLNDMW